MALKETLKKTGNKKARKPAFIIEPDCGWVGLIPTKDRSEKIRQIKHEYIDSRALLVTGTKKADFAECMEIKADISASDLIQEVGRMKKQSERTALIISGLDKVDKKEQEKFVTLLKERQILSSKLPEKIQIVIPVTRKSAVSDEVSSLCFWVEV